MTDSTQPQTKEKKSNQLRLLLKSDHNAKQGPLNTSMKQQTGQDIKIPTANSHKTA